MTQSANIKVIDVDKIGSAASPLKLAKTVAFISSSSSPRAGDVVVVRALTDSATYNMLELPTGRLAKINPGDLLIGVLGRRRALKGFVGDVPATVNAGDELHLLNMGGVIGCCTGHHSSLGDAIKLEVLGLACDEEGNIRNIVDAAIPPKSFSRILGATRADCRDQHEQWQDVRGNRIDKASDTRGSARWPRPNYQVSPVYATR